MSQTFTPNQRTLVVREPHRGAYDRETIDKILRAQEIAMRNRVPIVYLVDSAGVNLPYQDGIFPGQYGAGRIFLKVRPAR